MTNKYYPPPPPPPRKKLYGKKPHIILVRPKLQYDCGAWDLPDQKDKAALERVQAMCMVYSVDSTDFRHKNSGLLLLEKYRSNKKYLSGFIVMPFTLKRCQE